VNQIAYVIVPKFDENELCSWGLGDEGSVLLLVRSSGEKQLYTFNDFRNQTLPFENGNLFIFNAWNADQDIKECKQKFIDLLPPGASQLRFFIHFGQRDLASDLLTMPAIRKAFEETFPTSVQTRSECFPFTGRDKSQYSWSNKLWEIREKLIDGRLFGSELATLLDDVWGLASGRYRAEIPMLALLSALFPLYLTLAGGESSPDRAAANEATMSLIDNDSFRWAKLGVMEYSKLEGSLLTQGFNLQFPTENIPQFVEWFKCLSRACTKMLKE
jgi:hypothetical protein